MSAHASAATTARSGNRGKVTPAGAGLPDPRPLTTYTAAYSELEGVSIVTITLNQPCIIRQPDWGFVNCANGSVMHAAVVQVFNNVTIQFEFAGIIPHSVAFVQVPYQDMQVQNFQGGFVTPGAQWFRAPT